MSLSSWIFGGFTKPSIGQGDDNDASELNMHVPGAWDDTPQDRPLNRPAPPTLTGSSPEYDDDSVPAFPAPNSIQRSGSFRGGPNIELSEQYPSIKVPDSDDDAKLMPPPVFLPSRVNQTGSEFSRSSQQSSLSLPPSSSLLTPLSTTTVPANTNTKTKARAKVALTPAHSPLDWARLKSSGEDLRVCSSLLASFLQVFRAKL